jgi:hypothetical protein
MEDPVSLSEALKIVSEEIEKLPGWCTPEKGRRLVELTYGARNVVELGVFGGRSLLALSLPLKDQGYGVALGIDPYVKEAALEGTNDPANDAWWSGLNYAQIKHEALMSLERLGVWPHYCRILEARSSQAIKLFADGSIDVLHADGNHSAEVTCEEVTLYAPKMKQGSVWIADDTNWETTQKAQNMLLQRGFSLKEDHGTWRVFVAP